MKKISIIIICVILFMSILTIKVNATEEICKISISADKTELKKGDIVTINVLVSDVKNTEGIGVFYGILEYPENIFEVVFEEDESLIGDYEEYAEDSILYSGRKDQSNTIKNPWYMILIKEGTENEILASLDTEFSDDIETVKPGNNQIVGKIKLKVKDNVTENTAKITLTEMQAFESLDNIDSLEDGEVTDATMNLTIKVESENSNEENSNSNQENNNQKNKQEENKAKSNVPYTGIEDIIPVVFIMAMITWFAYINYKKYKDI